MHQFFVSHPAQKNFMYKGFSEFVGNKYKIKRKIYFFLSTRGFGVFLVLTEATAKPLKAKDDVFLQRRAATVT
jgi:hypothetical protein